MFIKGSLFFVKHWIFTKHTIIVGDIVSLIIVRSLVLIVMRLVIQNNR